MAKSSANAPSRCVRSAPSVSSAFSARLNALSRDSPDSSLWRAKCRTYGAVPDRALDRMSSPCGMSIDARVAALSAHAHDSGTCLELGFPHTHFAHDHGTAVALQAADVPGIDSKPGTAKACHLGNCFLAAGSLGEI